MHKTGVAIVGLMLLTPLVFLPGIGAGKDLIALFSQYLGLAALIAMALAQVIATRWPGVEPLFGPLDQSYRLHKWLGIGAMVAVLLHDTIDAEMRGLGAETLLTEAAETAGEISLYGLLILVVITVATFIPYHLWKWTHRLIGTFFVLGAFHYLFILKPFANGDALGLYMLAICGVGTLAFVWTAAPRGFRPAKSYVIDRLTPTGQALAVDLVPQHRPLRHRAGQFAFFSFSDAGLPEPHPFTISSAPRDDGALQVTIAPLGDLTTRLSRALAVGQSVRVEGPFGRFGQGAPRPQVWIGAGIGMTPFLALSQALAPNDPPVTLIYCVKQRADAPHLDRLEKIAAAKSNLTLVLWESAHNGRLTAAQVAQTVGDTLGQARVSFCGPSQMRRDLGAGLSAYGVSPRDYHYEMFEIRTGIGLRRLAGVLWAAQTKRSAG